MLKILFSPSEGKNSGGNETKKPLLGGDDFRNEFLQKYHNIIKNGSNDEICLLFGFKNFKDAKPYVVDIFDSDLMLSIQRYQGVAYDYLKYKKLDKNAQKYLQKNTIIFSNLFGATFGGDTIPNYKIKQTNDVDGVLPEVFYKPKLTPILDEILNDCDILDLRAGYYEKFYKIKKPYTTIKFLKNGKVVSHWAKAYRGIVLRELAKHNIKSIDEFFSLEIEYLHVKEIRKIQNKTQIICNIEE